MVILTCVYAVANSLVEDSGYRYVQIHEKGSDFGMLTCDLGKQAYTVDTYKFLIERNMLAPISLFKSALLLYVYFHFFIRSVKKNTFFYLF